MKETRLIIFLSFFEANKDVADISDRLSFPNLRNKQEFMRSIIVSYNY